MNPHKSPRYEAEAKAAFYAFHKGFSVKWDDPFHRRFKRDWRRVARAVINAHKKKGQMK